MMDSHKNAVIGKAAEMIWSPSPTLNHSETLPIQLLWGTKMLLPCKEKRWGRVDVLPLCEGWIPHLTVLALSTHTQPGATTAWGQAARSSFHSAHSSSVRGEPWAKPQRQHILGNAEGPGGKSHFWTQSLLVLHKLFCLPDEPSSAGRKKTSAQRQEIEHINHGNWCY